MTDKALQVFTYKGKEVRTTEIDGETWFVAKDVCDILEIVNHRDTVAKCLDEDEKRVSPISTPSNGGYSDITLISEAGLYTLLMRSNKPEAKPFRRWVTHDVLPSIRKTGSYTVSLSHEEIELRLKELDNSNKELDTRNKELDIKQQELNLRAAEIVRGMLDSPPFPITPETRTVFSHEVYRLTSGHECLTMLPECTDKWYTATDIGSVLGISAQKVGRIANKYGLKPPEGESNQYGRWIMSKSKYSAREVPSFIYSGNGLEWFREHKAVKS